MSIKIDIRNLVGIDWQANHYIYEKNISLQEFIDNGEIQVGDIVTVEKKSECPFTLKENEYCIVFNKNIGPNSTFFHEELFSLAECQILFGECFSY